MAAAETSPRADISAAQGQAAQGAEGSGQGSPCQCAAGGQPSSDSPGQGHCCSLRCCWAQGGGHWGPSKSLYGESSGTETGTCDSRSGSGPGEGRGTGEATPTFWLSCPGHARLSPKGCTLPWVQGWPQPLWRGARLEPPSLGSEGPLFCQQSYSPVTIAVIPGLAAPQPSCESARQHGQELRSAGSTHSL